MDFRKPDPGSGEGVQRGRGVVELNREVAGIEVQPDPVGEDHGGLCLKMESLEKGQRFRCVLEVTERLGLQAEVEVDLMFLREVFDEMGDLDQVCADRGFIGVEGFVRAG